MNWPLRTDEVDATFFDRPVELVAHDLIGRHLRVSSASGCVAALIVETEAYGDALDEASHAAFRPGGRAAMMGEGPGRVYVYSAYGMYPCFNIVTGPKGLASAVLLRGIWRIGDKGPVFGPGRTTRLLGIDGSDHGETVPGARFGVSRERQILRIQKTPRVGISRAEETLWRFVASFET